MGLIVFGVLVYGAVDFISRKKHSDNYTWNDDGYEETVEKETNREDLFFSNRHFLQNKAQDKFEIQNSLNTNADLLK